MMAITDIQTWKLLLLQGYGMMGTKHLELFYAFLHDLGLVQIKNRWNRSVISMIEIFYLFIDPSFPHLSVIININSE